MRRVSPEEAAGLLAAGHLYLDVRTPEEFALARPAGAYNVPWQLTGPTGPAPNPEFVAQVNAFCEPGTQLIVGCASGVRSLAAAAALEAAGYSDIVEQRAGTHGARDPFGRMLEKGWLALGLPSASGTDEERGYAALRQRASEAQRR